MFPDKRSPSFRPGHAIAGPFRDSAGARLWILEQLESQLVESRRKVWAEVVRALGRMSQDLGIELYLLDTVLHGKSFEQIARYIPRERRHVVDRRALAANDVDAA